jgi:hypothetical protein
MSHVEPPGTPGSPNLARTVLGAPRLFAAWALVGYAGLGLVFAFFDWVLPDGGSFDRRSAGAGFTALVELALPLVGALLATGAGLAPALPQARRIAGVAVAEYAAAVVLGALTWLIGLGSLGGDTANATFDGLAYVLLGLGRLALAALAGAVVYQAWVRLGGALPVKVVRATPPPS